MKVLYLSYDGMTDPLGQSQVLPYLLGLAQLGHVIHLMSFEKQEAYLQNKDIIHAKLKGSNITWHPLSYTKKPPVLSTLKDLWILHSTCKRLHQKEHFDFLHCRSYITSLVALSLKRKQNIPFIFDMRGFWADERVEGKIWDTCNFIFQNIYQYFKRKELAFISESHRIISLTHSAKNEILSWSSLPNIAENKIKVIPCCADLEHFNIQDPQDKAKTRTQLGVASNDLVISYVGSLGTWYMADEMLQLFKRIKVSFPQAKLLLVSTHSATEVSSYLAQAQLDPKDVVLKAGKRAEMPALIAASDLSMFFVRPSFSKKASSPTKMGEIMGCGIPLICNTGIGDVEPIMNDTQCGIYIHDFSEISLQSVVDKIPELLNLNPVEIREGAFKYYSLQEGIKRYNEIYTSIKSI